MYSNPSQKISRIFGFFFLLLGIFSGCDGDQCVNQTCENGFCVEGDCNCALGYEGEDCSIEARSKFIHPNWLNSLFCQSSANTLSTSVSSDAAAINAVKLSGLFEANDIVFAEIAHDSMTIPIQVYKTAYVEGLGILNDSTLTIEFAIVETDGQRNNCIAVIRKN